MLGTLCPRSTWLTKAWLTPARCATCRCVRPATARAATSSCAIRAATSAASVLNRNRGVGMTTIVAVAAQRAVTFQLLPVCYDAFVTFTRRTKAIIAAVLSVGWLLYMIVGLQVINVIAPTSLGNGPDGTAAFVGLVSGIFVCGSVMWAASD